MAAALQAEAQDVIEGRRHLLSVGVRIFQPHRLLLADLDLWIREYNEQRPHQGRWCFGKTPMQTFLDAMPMAKEKMIAA